MFKGEGINKSVNLIQKATTDPYTPWAKRVDSNWDLTDDWLFPDIYYNKASQQLNKFPVDKAWIYDGITADMSPATEGTYIDVCTFGQKDISLAGSKLYNYKINDQAIKTNGCWAWMFLGNSNLASGGKITITTNDSSTNVELRINRIQVRVATGSPNLTQLENYVKSLGWRLEMANNNNNNIISFFPIDNEDTRARLYIRMSRNPKAKDVSDCLNLILV